MRAFLSSTHGILLTLLAGWLLVFLPIIPEMVDTWLNHSDNSHALLVPIIVGYLIWGKKEELARTPLSGSFWGWVFLCFSLVVYLISFVGGVAFIARLMMVAAFGSLVWCCFGREIVKVLAFPLVFLFFMVPVPDTLLGMVSFPLQLFATKVSAGVIKACTIPVVREGNLLFFINTQLEVAEACSGIRSIMALSMISALFAFLFQKAWWRRIVLLASAIPVALIANILRVSGTGILAHFFGDKVARGFLHEFSGLVVFAFGLIVLFLEFQILQRIGKPEVPDHAA